MASPAAVLDILLVANTKQATASLAKTQGQLSATGKTATATSATVKKAMLGIGFAAVGAATALYKIGEAFDDSYDTIRTRTGATGKELGKLKESFRDVVSDVPTDFETAAKAVSGINQRLGLTGKPLSKITKQFTELSRITGTDIDTNVQAVTRAFGDWEVATRKQSDQLDKFFRASQASGTSVSDLASEVVQFGAPLRQFGFSLDEATAMFASFEEAGVNTQTMMPGLKFALRSFMEAGLEPGKALQETFAGIEDGTLKTQKAFEIFGGRATPDMIEAIQQGRFELDKLTETLKTGDSTIRGVGKQTMDMSEQWQLFKNNALLALEPVAKRVFTGLGDLMADVTKAFKKEGLQGVIDLLLQKLNDAIPKIAEMGGKLAGALVKGFLNAPILAQLAVGGWLLSKFGGSKGFSAVGSKAGQWFALAFIAAWEAKEVAKIISGEMLDATSREMKAADLEKIGYTAVQFIGKGMIAAFDPSGRFTIFRQKNGEWINKVIDDFKDWKQIPALALRNASDSFKNWDVWLQRIVDTGHGKSKKFLDTVGDHFKGVADDADSFSAKAWSKWDRFGDHLTGPGTRKVQTWRRSLADLFGSVPDMSDKDSGDAWKYWRDFGTNLNSEKGSGQVATFKSAVTRSFTRLANVSIGAISNLASETKKTLDGFGAQSSNVYVANSAGGGSGDGIKAQTGTIVPGIGNGDKVPAMLEPGEVVLNKKAVAAMGGAGRANSINSMIPRFASGGVVEQALGPYAIPPIAYDPNHAGGNSHLHLDFFTQQQAIAYGKKMQSMGWSVGEYSGPYGGFGPITTQHQSPGHYDGTAFDANTPADETRAEVAAVAKLLGSGVAGGAVAAIKQIKRVLLEGPAGPLTDMGQAALDKVRKAANAYISKQQPKVTSGASSFDPSGAAGALSRGQMRGLLGKVGLPDIMGWVAYAESGFNPSAHNASGASGLWQIMMPLHAAIVNGNVFDPLVNAQAAKTLYSQSGLTPWAASKYEGQGGGWAQHMGQAFASGGIAGKLAKIKGGGHYAGTGYTGPWASTIHGGGHKPPGPSHYTPNPYTGTASRPAAQLPKWLQDQIGGVGYVIAILEEQIDNAQTLAGFSSSEMGTALGPGEKAQQIGLYEGLLRKLVEGAGLIKQGLGTPFLDLEVQSTLSSALENIQGITGSGGRILQVRQALDELYAKNASASGMSISDLLGFSAAVMAGAFKTQPYMGAFAGGGVALVGEQGPELAHLPSGTRVHSAGDTREMMEPSVEVNFLGGGMEWLADYLEIKVNGVVQKIDKDKRRKALAGAR